MRAGDEGSSQKVAGSVAAAARSVPVWGLHEGKGACVCRIWRLSQTLLAGEVEELL